MPCKKCGEIVKNVGYDIDAVTCWKCVNVSLIEYDRNPKLFIANVQDNTGDSE
jgi:hypothetical protein